MSGDWIKMRTDLHLDSKVDAMAEFLASKPAFAAWALDPSCGGRRLKDVLSPAAYVSVTRSAVVTGLLVTWGVTRRDGVVDGDDLIVSPQTIDTITRNSGIPNMGEAMAFVGWAVVEGENSVRYPKALINLTSPEERQREKDAERKRRQRDRERDQQPDESREKSRQSHAKITPRVDKSREDKTPVVPIGFARFIGAYPPIRINSRKKALATWQRDKLEPIAATIVAHVEALSSTPDWQREGGKFVPNVTTYLNDARWESNPGQRGDPRFAGAV